MTIVKALQPYRDERGNEIVFAGKRRTSRINIKFVGGNNRLVIAANAQIVELGVDFEGDGSIVEIGPTHNPRTGLRFGIRVGHDCGVRIGTNVGSQGRTMITAVEGTDVTLGDDCMLASGIEIRSDDSHPIYDVRTEQRVNLAQSIAIGDHVWLAKHATIMGGAQIGSGAIIGFRSVVTSDVPNNAVAVGSPARVVRRDTAWERPMVMKRQRGETGPRPGEKHEQYWNLTDDEAAEWPTPPKRPERLDPASLTEWASHVPEPLPAARATQPRATPVMHAGLRASSSGLVRQLRRRARRVLRRLRLR